MRVKEEDNSIMSSDNNNSHHHHHNRHGHRKGSNSNSSGSSDNNNAGCAEEVASRIMRENPVFLEDWLKRHLGRSARLRDSLLRAAARADKAAAAAVDGLDAGVAVDDDAAEEPAVEEDEAPAAADVIVAPPRAFSGPSERTRLSPLPSANEEEDYTPLEEAHIRYVYCRHRISGMMKQDLKEPMSKLNLNV